MGVSKNRGIPKSSILIGFSIINHPFWGTLIFGNPHIDALDCSQKWPPQVTILAILGRLWRGTTWSPDDPTVQRWLYLGSVVVRVGRIADTITHRIHVEYIYLHLPWKSTKCRQIYHTWILWVMKCFLSNFEILQLGSPNKGLNWYTSCVLWWLAERQCTKMCSAVVASNWRISIHDCSSSGCTFSFDPDSTSIFCSQLKVGMYLWATRNGTMRFVNPFAPGSCKGAEGIIFSDYLP